jgi:hypothetical protein
MAAHLVKDLGQHWQDGLQVCAWGDELKCHKILQRATPTQRKAQHTARVVESTTPVDRTSEEQAAADDGTCPEGTVVPETLCIDLIKEPFKRS